MSIEVKTPTDRRAATTAGLLFFVGTAAGVLSIVGAADGSDYLRAVAANESRVLFGALFQMITAAAYVGVAFALHPVLRRSEPTAAAGFLGFRIAAGVLNMLGALVLLLLLEVSRQFVGAGVSDAAHFLSIGALIRQARDSVNHIAMILALCAGDAMLYWVLLRARLLPRWLSVWGFIGLALAAFASLLVMWALIEVLTTIYMALTGALALQQLVLAVWLIVKGLDASGDSKPLALAETT